MKFLAVVILVAFQGLTLAQGQSIKDIIEDFIQSLKERIPEPVVFPNIDLAAPDNDYVTACANATNNTLGGLRDFGVKVDYRGIIIPIPTGFTVTIRNLNYYTDLLTEVQIINSSLPSFNTDVIVNTLTSDLVIKGDLEFTLLPLNFSVTSLDITIGGILFNIEGVLTDRFSESLSKFLTEHTVKVANRVLESFSSLLVDVINGIISGIFNEMNINPERVSSDASQERAAQQLKQFFEILKTNFGLQLS